jgi:hypothetical protein
MCNRLLPSLAFLGSIALAAAAHGQQFVITGELRQVFGTATAGGSGPGQFDSDFESVVAGDFDPFDESVDALADVLVRGGTAFASAEAAQASSLATSVLAASGSFSSVAGMPSGASVFTETFNTYTAQFQVDASGPVLLNLHGFMVGGPTGSFQRSIVKVFLNKVGGTLFSATTETFAPGAMVELDELIEVEPGAYSLHIIGTSAISDLPGPGDTLPKTVMQGGFDINLSIGGTGPDLNGDGIVDGLDLGLLLGAWGACPAADHHCDADLDGNDVVNGLDLALLLAAWGTDGN